MQRDTRAVVASVQERLGRVFVQISDIGETILARLKTK